MSDQRADDWLFLSILFLLAAIVLMLLAMVLPAGAGQCMNKSQARHAYPGKWLYWHGKNHCWDATPGRNIIHLRRPVSPLIAPEPVPIIEDAPSFVPWDARIGIPIGKTPQEN
jgi:hypothetical protein